MTAPSQRLTEAEYRSGARKDRCEACAHVAVSRLHLQAGRYDRHCTEHDCPVKTHGTCSEYLPGEDTDLPRDEFPSKRNDLHFF